MTTRALLPEPLLTMLPHPPSVTTPSAAAQATAAMARSAPVRPVTGKGFSQALQQVQSASTLQAGAGDTLIGMVREFARARGQAFSPAQEFRMAQKVASANQISDPNRIFVGQKIDLAVLEGDMPANNAAYATFVPAANFMTAALPSFRLLTPAQMTLSTQAGLARSQTAQAFTPPANAPTVASGVSEASADMAGGPLPTGEHPVLAQTLERAVAKGFIPSGEKTAVYDKILSMASNHGFAPDDFARMTLMESDGMNPRASNQRCHGIIQFCDGPARGAASSGYGANPKAILDLSVHKQLSLVDKYFDDVGLKSKGPAGLEDLYLSVLNPASRSQSRADAPLNIPGPQARSLHVDHNSAAPITRQSIRQGLLQNAAQRLGDLLPPSLRQQAQRAQQYVQNNLP
ncbi:MAG: hypothetical protein WCO17_13350 [Betaproteobacteria bacterium]